MTEPDRLADWLASYMRGLHGELNPTPHDHRFAQQKQGASVARMLRAALADGALTPEDLGMERAVEFEKDARWLSTLARGSSWPGDMAQAVETAAENVRTHVVVYRGAQQ